MAVQMYRFCNMNSGHCQLGRSLERILEEAHLSGELKLSNRKLKDFPKSATKYDLSDTVFADLSRNRFSELPEEITSFAFLETLILYHNTIRQISDMVKGLSSLTYLDLRSNQLSSLPREICFLPIRVLLIANNRLIVLPEELGRMEKLTELDASCNLLTNLPPRMGDLKNLKSLSLRNNQLVYLPREITTLSLISLNVSSNRISSLPVEIRLMTTLVDLNLENNPLTSPPAGLCVRGLVHVFKFLEMQATKDDNKSKSCGLYDGYSTLRRTSRSANGTLENNKTKKNPIDSVCIINDGLDKLLSQDALNVPIRNNTTSLPKPSILMNMQANGINLSLKNQKSQQLISDIGNYKNCGKSIEQQYQQQQNADSLNIMNNVNNSAVIFDDGFIMDNNKLEDRNKNLGNIQTYKEYKEALKQQRNQEIANLYKTKGHKNFTDESDNVISSIHQQQESVVSEKIVGDKLSPEIKLTAGCHKNGPYFEDIQITSKKPVQKVIPSRNVLSLSNSIPMTTTSTPSSTQQNLSTSFTTNLNNDNNLESSINNDDDKDNNDYYKYSKPKSPTKCNGMMVSINNTINNTNNSVVVNTINSGTKAGTNIKVQPFKSSYRNINWNQDMVPSGKLSFTMRREFDKQKEETELIAQLRSIIETRLKMNVPEDIASALTDGVILCHLANHVRPRSVASIHVPSPGVPKLTMARCRRNVDNFLEACRKIGVDEELICSCEDVVSSDEINYNNYLPNPSAVFKTITALINIIEHQQQQHHKGNQLTPATNHHYHHHHHQQQMITTTTTASTVMTTTKVIIDDNNYNGNGINCNKEENIEEEDDDDNDDDDTFDTSTSTMCENDEINDVIYDESNNEKIENDVVMHTCINVPRSPSIKKLLKTEKNNDSGIILNDFESKFLSKNDENDQNHHSYYNCHTVNTVDHVHLFGTENYLKYGEEILNVNNLNIENNEKNFILMSNNDNENDGGDGNNDDFTKNNIDMNREINTPEKIVTKRIEFFEGNHQKLSTNNDNNSSNRNNNINNNNNNNNNSHKYENSVIFSICKPHSNIIEKKKKYLSSNYHKQQDSTLFTIFLSCVFLITFLLLIVFPISN